MRAVEMRFAWTRARPLSSTASLLLALSLTKVQLARPLEKSAFWIWLAASLTTRHSQLPGTESYPAA